MENIFDTAFELVISSLKNEGVYTWREFTQMRENDIRDLSDTNLKNQTRKNMIRLRRMVRFHVENKNNYPDPKAPKWYNRDTFDDYLDKELTETETVTETKSILRNTSTTDVPDNKVTEVEVQLASIATNNVQLLRKTRLPGTNRKYCSLIKWYNTQFEGRNFDKDSGNVILCNLMEHCQQANGMLASTKHTKMCTTKSSLIDQHKWDISKDVLDKFKELNGIFSMQKERTNNNGQEYTNPDMMDADLIHIVGTLISIHIKGIPNNVFQEYLKALTVRTLITRTTEMHMIALGSLKYYMEVKQDINTGKTVLDKNGKTEYVRSMQFTSVMMKGKGVGSSVLKFHENELGVHKNLILWWLVWCERRGIIDSAESVYAGEEQLTMNRELYETEIDLTAKAETANKAVNDQSHQYLSNSQTGEFPKRFFDELRKVDIKNIAAGTHKITTWVSCLCSGLVTSKRYDHERNASFSRVMEMTGYISSKEHRLGLTCFRSGGRQDLSSNNIDVGGIDRDHYLSVVAGHTRETNLRNYTNRNHFKSSYGNNIAQNGVCKEIVHMVGTKGIQTPAYEVHGYFHQDVTIIKDINILPSTVEFLQTHGKFQGDIPASDCVSNGDLFKCAMIGCNEQFKFLGDLVEHASKKGHPQGNWAVPCGNDTNSFYIYRKHITDCKKCKKQGDKVGMAFSNFKMASVENNKRRKKLAIGYLPCPVCELKFPHKKALKEHKNRKHKQCD